MVEAIPIVSMFCLTLVSIVALGNEKTASKALDTLKEIVKSIFRR